MTKWSVLLLVAVQTTFALPQAPSAAAPSAAATSTADALLLASISSAVASASLKPYATPLAADEINEWGAYGDSFTAGIGSNGLGDYQPHSQDCSRYNQGG